MDEKSKVYVGMDVHKDTVMVAVLPEGAPEPTVVKRLPNEPRRLKRWLARISRQGEIRACYEASGAGDVRRQRASKMSHRGGGRDWVARRSGGVQSGVVQPFREQPREPGHPRTARVVAHRAVGDAQRGGNLAVAAPEFVLQAQQLSDLAHGQPFLRHPLPPRLRGPSARREKGAATAGSPAPLLAHSRVIGMRRNPQLPGALEVDDVSAKP